MTEMNRRQFLTAGVAGTTGLVLENKSALLRTPAKPWNAHPARTLRKFRDPLPTACVACPSTCALVASRDGDRVCQVMPAEVNPGGGRTCARAYEALEALYDPERVLRPRRRVGRRGEGKWEEISWGAAIDRIAEALAAAPDRAYVDVGRPDPLAGALLPRLGIERVVEEEASRSWAARQAQRAVYGLPLAPPDLSAVRTVLLVGTRPLDGGGAFSSLGRSLTAARSRGARLVAVGPYQGATGSVADEWLPVRPGAEALVLLGLARIALAEGWLDREAFVRTVGTPAEDVLASLAPYAPDRVAAQAGIPARRLAQLARRFAEQAPSLCLVDGSGRRDAEAVEAAAAVLNSLGGDPEGKPGIRLAHRPDWLPGLDPTLPRTRAVQDLVTGHGRASLYLAYRTNPVYWSPRSDAVREAFADEGRIGLLVAMDTQLTETAALADLVLPAAADLELWNLLGGYTGSGEPFAILQQPTPKVPSEAKLLQRPDVPLERLFDGPTPSPIGEARQLGDVLLELLAVTGSPARQDFPHADAGAYVRHLADTVPPLAAAGGFEALSRVGVWQGETATYPWAARDGYPTRTGTLEVGGGLGSRPAALPPPSGGEAFALVALRYAELDPAYANSRWGREIRHQNPLYMNAAVARKMGLRPGAPVVVRTAVGEVATHVTPIEGIHPQAVALAEDFGHWAGGVAATARSAPTGEEPQPLLVSRKDFLANPLGITRQTTQPGEIPWWGESGPGVSVPGLRPIEVGPDGGETWREIPVTVHPARSA